MLPQTVTIAKRGCENGPSLAAATGMRRGEILGLRWADVDLGAKRLSVRQALRAVACNMRFSDVKTAAGRRTIDISVQPPASRPASDRPLITAYRGPAPRATACQNVRSRR